MPSDTYSLDELATQLGRDRREIERLAARGRIPGRKVAGAWTFHTSDIAQWLESEMRDFSDSQLLAVEQAHRSEEVDAEVPVSSLLKPELIEVPLEARTRRAVLERLVEVAGRTWQVWEPAAVLKTVQEREELMSTAFDQGVAIPHWRQPIPEAVGESVIAFGRTFSGIPFGAANNSLTDLFFLVLCRDARTHLHVLARLGRMLRREEFLPSLRAAQDATEAYQAITAADRDIG